VSSSRSLSRHLAIAYIFLLVYACLHPLGGWQSKGLPVFGYLFAPWPKYFIFSDFILNILGFVPLGLTLTPSLPRSWSWRGRVVAVTLFGLLLSFSVETLQVFLPARAASNTDISANVLGTLLGALLGARWGQALFAPGHGLARWREQYITDGRTGDAGLILILLWLLVQLMPSYLLFAGGGVRALLGITPPLPFEAGRLIAFETAQTASMMVAVGLFARCTLRLRGRTLVAALLVLGIGARTAASAFFFTPSSPWVWLSAGTEYGVVLGGALLFVILRLSRVAQHALAGMGLLMACVLINMMPESPYLQGGGPGFISNGNYANFHGLCRLVAAGWPFAALAYLSAVGLWRGERLEDGSGAGRPP
jgi:VanZ family protein